LYGNAPQFCPLMDQTHAQKVIQDFVPGIPQLVFAA